MDIIEPMHRNKPNITYLLTCIQLVCNILTYLIMTINLISWNTFLMYIEEKQMKEIFHLRPKQCFVSNEDMNDE